ncbi:MAG: hypothetical protein QOG31_1737 [Thermoplasmata archaeon]|nr:hypothetical protein [Thermoplasmata archaeon]
MSRRPQRVPRGDTGHRAGRPQATMALRLEAPTQAAAQDAHCVLLYQDERFLVEAIGAWAEAGLRAGEGVILVARATVGDQVRAWLKGADMDPLAFEVMGRLRVLDADRTMRLFMVGGKPQANLFTNVVAPLVEDAKKASPAGEVRAWGEMVDLLWKRAQGPAAVALESLWNDLIATHAFRLFCAYQVDAFDAIQFPKVRAIAASHGLVLPAEDEARMATAVDGALAETYGSEADAVRAFLGPAPRHLPLPLHRLLALHGLAPEFGALVAARAGQLYREAA